MYMHGYTWYIHDGYTWPGGIMISMYNQVYPP
jgi:hypothetical protein